MSDEVHRLDRLHIQASFSGMEQAYALRPRLDALGQRLVPSLLERLFDAQTPAGMTLQIDRLDLDLGVLRPDHLEEDALKALEEALGEALGRAIHSARNGPSPHARLMSKAEHRLMQFETYLATGVAPYAGGEPFDASSRLRELADEQPAALVAMLKRRGHDRYLLERLVLQAGEDGLRHLLSVLAPGDAAIILVLMADAVLAFGEAPIAPLQYAAEPALRRILWVVTLEFLLRDAGSQFNRRSYLAFVLEREAAQLRIAYPLLLRLLAAAVQRASARSQRSSSLQRTLSELLQGLGSAERPDALATRRDRTGRGGAATLLGDLESLSAMAGAMDAPDFEQLVHNMAAGEAAMVLAILEQVVARALVGSAEGDRRAELAGFARAWALDRLGRAADGSVDGRAFERGLEAAIKARFPAGGEEASDPSGRDEALALVEHFLRTGHPTSGGSELPEIARNDGPRLAALARRLAREKPNSVLDLADRLLGWLLPDELVEVLAPNEAERLLSAGQAPWRELVGSLLRDEPPVLRAAGASLGALLDRRAVVSAWLDASVGAKRTARGRSGGGAAPDLQEALNALPNSSAAELISLFLAEDEEATAARLWRGLQALDAERREVLLAKLAPWAINPAGPLAATTAPLDPARRLEVLCRAAAATLAGGKVDVAGLARPLDLAAPPSVRRASRPRKAAAAQRPSIQQLLAWLDGAAAAPAETALLGRYFAELADAGDPALTEYLSANRGRRSARARWVKRLPEEGLGRLAHILAPAGAQALLDSVQVISAAWRQVAPFGMRGPTPNQIWDLLLEHMADRGRVDLPAVVDAMMRRLTDGDAGLLDRLKTRSSQLAQAGGHAPLVAAMRRPPKSSASAAPRKPQSPRVKSGERDPAEKPRGPEPGQTLYVFNAGLVLFNPFLPTLFERLGLLTPKEAGKPRIVGVEAASRAAHLLQYLVDGRLDRPEPELALNKLLSGQSISQPIERAITPRPSDLEICDQLLDAVIGHWPVLRNSSHAALRETFLQREGRLQRGDGKWTLQVQRKTLDVLVDQVPWGFAVVYHPWMDDPVHVTW